MAPPPAKAATHNLYPSPPPQVPRSWAAVIPRISQMNLSQAPVIWHPNSDWFPYRATLTMTLKKREQSWCIQLSLTQLASEQDAVGMEKCWHQQIF